MWKSNPFIMRHEVTNELLKTATLGKSRQVASPNRKRVPAQIAPSSLPMYKKCSVVGYVLLTGQKGDRWPADYHHSALYFLLVIVKMHLKESFSSVHRLFFFFGSYAPHGHRVFPLFLKVLVMQRQPITRYCEPRGNRYSSWLPKLKLKSRTTCRRSHCTSHFPI